MDNRGRWYTLQTLSGKEMKVKESLEKRLLQEGLQDYVFEVLVPTEKVSETRDGKRKVTNRKLYPGYVFIHLDLFDAARKLRENVWYFVKDTNGVINFLGEGDPVPLSQTEIDDIKATMLVPDTQARPKISFSIGENVKIIEGAFESLIGTITSIDPERSRLQVSVNIFNRETPVLVEFWQVERVEE